MKVAIGADPLGFELKEKVKAHLLAEGYEMLDLGTLAADEPVKYIEVSDRVAVSVQTKESEFGIVFCGTGMGVSIVANKHKGVYCALVESQWAARECRIVNNANMLAMGGRILGEDMANDIADTFLYTKFCENSPQERFDKLSGFLKQVYELEETQFK
ncbi:putative sugar phosphate isomerase YwlF [Lachnospiraceae bacterium]|nr:putative sugar phosphate isomerase YwlF [Lachnospiraceae bacterium]